MQTCRVRPNSLIAAMFLAGSMGIGGAAYANSDEVTFTWKSRPTREFPPEVRTIAVVPPIFDNSGQSGGIVRSDAEKWYAILHGQIKKLFARARPQARIAERIDLGSVYAEKARRASGTTDGRELPQAFRGADAIIVARLTIHPPYPRQVYVPRDARKRMGEWMYNAIPYLPNAHSGRGEYVTVIDIEVACDLKLVLVGTGVDYVTYSNPLRWQARTDSGFMGFGARDVLHLPDAQLKVNELMRQHVEEFCSEFMPVQRSLTARLPDLNDELEEAVVQFNLGRVDLAGQMARLRFERRPKDHQACFILGVCSESRGAFEWAAEWYRRAVTLKNERLEYRQAYDRVRDRVDMSDVAYLPDRPAESQGSIDTSQDEDVSAVRVVDDE